ncbi:MAG TPA: iron ABC transporter substrate-binding protein [Actinomycetota bacterium]|nr:iron ABC transporter substrate-binding protein [Actinomycetota bacterium]
MIGGIPRLAAALLAAAALLPACRGGGEDVLVVYSGREQSLVQPLLERFARREGIRIQVRYGDTAELASTILEEGENSPADVFFAQDAGALGALDAEGRLSPLPERLLERVDPRFRSPEETWVGLSGRARVAAYSTERVDPDALPASVLEFTDPRWRGRIGWAPTNGSFQAFVTALRLLRGEDGARAWLEGMLANEPVEYPSNLTAVDGVADGEVDVALVNHYYLFVLREEEGPDYPVENHYAAPGDPGSLVNVAGVGMLDTADDPDLARGFVDAMLSPPAQRYFAEETHEYPLIDGVPIDPGLVPLSRIQPPDIDLSDLSDLQGTLALLRETGVLP